MSATDPVPLPPFEERAETMLSRVFRGMHHVYSLKKFPTHWTCLHYGDFATYDNDVMTRLVLGAHEYCIRLELHNGGPRTIKITLAPRTHRNGDDWSTKHHTIEQAIERWEKRER